MSAPAKFRFVSTDRRVREDRRFVVGKGRFAADVAPPGIKHVALVTCPHPAARIVVDRQGRGAGDAGRALRARRRASLPARPTPLLAGLDTPNVPRRPLAVGRGALCRRMGRGGGRRHAARSPRTPPSWSRSNTSRCRSCSTARRPTRPAARWCIAAHGSNVLLDRTFVWGEVEKDFAASPHKLRASRQMGPQLDRADRDLRRDGELGPLARDARRLGLDPDAEDIPTRSRCALQAAGARRCACTTTSTSAAATASSAASSTPCWSAISRAGSAVPVRLIEDRLENMRGGDMHGPGAQLRRRGRVRRCRRDPLDEDARARQCRRLCRALAVPARQAGRRHRRAVPHQERAVPGDRGASPTRRCRRRCAPSASRRPTTPSSARSTRWPSVSASTGSRCGGATSSAHEEFPYLIPSGTTYDSGDYHAVIDKVLAQADYAALVAERDRLRARGHARRHRHRRLPRAERRQFVVRAAAQSQERAPPPGWNPAASTSISAAPITATMHTHVGRAGPRDAGRHRGRRGAGDRSRPHPRGAAGFARRRCRATARSAAAWRSCWAARRSMPRRSSRTSSIAIAAHDLGVPAERVDLRATATRSTAPRRDKQAHLDRARHHRAPPLSTACRPAWSRGSRSATSCRCRPAARCRRADGRVQMYPCFSFEFHLVLVAIDPDLGKPEIKRYVIGHDCGTVINPKIVRGMTMGGIAHGIGAALLRGVRLQRRRPADGAELHGLSAAVVARGAAGRDRASRDAVAAHRVRPEGLGRDAAISARRRRSRAPSTTRSRRSASWSNSLPIKIAQLGDMIAADAHRATATSKSA